MRLLIPDLWIRASGASSTAANDAKWFVKDPDWPTIAAFADAVPNELLLTVTPTFDLQAAGGAKRFKMVAYTGGPLRLPNFDHPVIVDGNGLSVASNRLPALKDHKIEQVVGHTETVTITAATGHVEVEGLASGDGPAATEVIRAAKQGFPWQVSIGAPVQELELVDKGESVTVNGRLWMGPLYVARKATLREISFVALGADPNTWASIAAQKGATTMEFEAWIKAQGWDPATISAQQRTTLQAAYDAQQKPKPTPTPTPTPSDPPVISATDAVAAIRKQTADELARIQAIRTHCHAHPDIEARAIAEGWDVAKTELEVLRSSRAQGPFAAGGGKAEINAAACMEASLCLSAGLKEDWVGKRFEQKVMNEALGDRYRGARISTLMFETIRAAGMHTRVGAITDETIRVALRADRRLRAGHIIQADGFSTLSLSGVLSNVANKSMLAAYEAQDVVWPLFCAIRNHGDFKVHTQYRLDMTGSLRKVGATGELKHVGMQDTSFTNQLDTYGALIVLNRQMQINDDLGAFLTIPTSLGTLAAIRPEEAFFVLLLGNATSFFSTANKNIITGATGVMTAANGVAAITLAETKFSNQVSVNNKPIMVPPARILCGTVNYVPARNIYEGRMKITGKDQTEVSNNEHAGKYEPIKSAFVNNTAVKDEDGNAITGQSSTAWWLFADPARRAAIGMAFLNGNRVPTIESDDTEFSVLGMQWRCFFDFGVGYEDPAAAVQLDGA